MTIELSDALRNVRLDAIDTDIGTAGQLIIYAGTIPTTTGGTAGTVILTLTLNNPAFGAASGGVMALNVSGLSGAAVNASTETASYFRITDGTDVLLQGTISASGGGGDMIIDNTSVANGQTVTVTSFSLTDGNDEDTISN